MEAPTPNPPIAQALRKQLPDMMPRLVAYAARRLRRAGWVDGRDCAPSGADAEDAVQKALLSCVTGKRPWPPGVPLEAFLRGAIRSVTSHEVEAQVRRSEASSEEGGDRAAPSSEREAALNRWHLIHAIKRDIKGKDPDVEALFAAHEATHGDSSRGELAARLGWTPERVTWVRKKMNELLARMGYVSDDDDERLEGIRPRGAAPPPRRRAR